MEHLTIAIGADHAGYALKEHLKELATVTWIDCGAPSAESVDYPDYAHAVSEQVLANKAQFGVLICATGIGMSMAANRHPGIRAALCTDLDMVASARWHNNANVLVLGAKMTSFSEALAFVRTFLTTSFEGGRHLRRVKKIECSSSEKQTSCS